MSDRMAILYAGCAMVLGSTTAGAEVFQCVGADGRMLLTDGGCPAGYSVNLVVGEPPLPEETLAYQDQVGQRAAADADRRAAAADAERRAAEAEIARLRAELEAERRRDGAQHNRIDMLDRKLDELLDRPQLYGGAVLVPAPVLPWCGPAGGRPWVDCRPPRPVAKPYVYRPEKRENCGMFGCPPSITHAPWDDRRWTPGSGLDRYERR